MPFMWPKQVIWPLFKFYDLSTHFIGTLSVIGDYLIRNNIFLDKAMNYLLIYLNIIDQIIVNHDKRWDPLRHSP
jgi:hypothetical protein